MVHVAKALRWQDAMRSFRAVLRNEIERSLVYYQHQKPSPVDLDYSTKCLDLFLAETTPSRRLRRCVILSLANGDWRKRRRQCKLIALPPPCSPWWPLTSKHIFWIASRLSGRRRLRCQSEGGLACVTV
eukprot:7455165-Pyramimonas_sp.AAC.1